MQNLIEIQQQIAELQKQEKLMLAQEYSSAKEKVQSLVTTYKIPASDLIFEPESNLGAKKLKVVSTAKKAVVKYRDEAGHSWSGRGLKPRWLSAALESGRKLEEFLIQA